MKRISAGVAFFLLGVVPAFAAEPPTHGTKPPPATAGTVPRDAPARPMKQMMHNPQHLLMMAYHRNVANFGHALYLAAEVEDTVPAPVARTAVAEMRRAMEEMEKQRVLGMRDTQVHPERRKILDDHLVQVKMQLRQLEDLAKKDRVDAAEIRKHLQAIFEECEGAGCDTMPGAMHGGHPHRGAPGRGAMPGCRCESPLPQHGVMMQRMMQKVKRQDAELAGLVQEMKGASRDNKVDLLVEAVSAMVQQRSDMTAEMERMQRKMMRYQPGMGPGMMQGDDGDYVCECDEEPEDDAP